MATSENEFEALIIKIKGNKDIDISKFKEIDNNGNLKEVILDGDYDEDMINRLLKK